MTMTTCNSAAPRLVKPRSSVREVIAQVLATQSQRRALRKLDRDALCDLGLTYAEAKSEADRPFWDVPATWRH